MATAGSEKNQLSKARDTKSTVGIQSCGCITFALAGGEPIRREDERAMARIVRNGGRIEQMDDEVLRRHPDFLPWECPHDPKGWEPRR